MNKEIKKEELKNLLLEDNTDPVRIHVHPKLEEEFQFWKKKFEDMAGYEIEGGRPIISKLCAHILKELRTKTTREEKRIIIEIHKIVGVKKVKLHFL